MPARDIQVKVDGGGDAGPWLSRKLRNVIGHLGITRCQWSISIVGDREMKKLHGKTMNDWGTTDVLTFDMRDPAERLGRRKNVEGTAVDLDTVVCADEARRRAREMGHEIRQELLLYCVHSLLHVQGHDDVKPVGARKMHAREDELLVAAGVGAVYGGVDRRKSPSAEGQGMKVKRSRRG
jgi:probable rRNA maturation factor